MVSGVESRPESSGVHRTAPPPSHAIKEHRGTGISPSPSTRAAVSAPGSTPPATAPAQIVLITGGMGGGHASPMGAVSEHLTRDHAHEIHVRDPGKVTVAPFVAKYLPGDGGRGWADNFFYTKSNHPVVAKFANGFRRVVTQRQAYNAVQQIVRDPQHEPTLAVVNHRILGNATAAKLPRETPMALLTADPGNIHKGWYPQRLKDPGSKDMLFVPGQDGLDHALRCGVPNDRIAVLGYPVRPAFEQVRNESKADLRAQLNLPTDKKVLLVTSGGGAWPQKFMEVVTQLARHPEAADKIYIVAVASGSDPNVRATLVQELGENHRVLGPQNQEELARYMRASDLMGIKAGGATIGECYAVGVVPIVYDRLSGIEHSNVRHIQKHNTGVVALKTEAFIHQVLTLDESTLSGMRTNQDRAMPTIGAAGRIANRLSEIAVHEQARRNQG